MQGGGVRIAFAALELVAPKDVDLHITIARRYDVTEADIRAMQHDLERLIRPHLPIQVTFGNFCHLGEHGTFPAYKVSIENIAVQTILQQYHTQYYKEAPGKALYPKLKFHVTVDTPEKRDFLEGLMRAGERGVLIHDTLFRTMTKGAEPVFTREGKWVCPDCDTQNPLDQKECGSPYCDQWRPKAAVPPSPVPPREGDWACTKCTYPNFASRAVCAKCAQPKAGPLQQQHAPGGVFNPYEAPPPSAPPAPRARNGGRGDWYCPVCQFTIYAHKSACGKCHTKRPN
jgi:hypothetical protein